jgi:ADP-heptose:LPS heptosyltransferase
VPLPLATEQAELLSTGLLDSLRRTGEAPTESIEQLCALAIADDPAVACAGSLALFRNIVEPLGDSFEPALDALYVRFFSSVIDYCRRQPSFRVLDGLLREYGLKTKQQLLDRAARIRSAQYPPVSNAAIKRVRTVLVPSRVTLGADVAVTSVILNRMKAVFPNARMALLGNAKARSLFASDARVELIETAYPRGGTLRERLDAWGALCHSVSKHLESLTPDEYVLVDPDSRLTQLGLLPLARDESRYYLFQSRSYSSAGFQPLALLTGCWLDDVFGDASPTARGSDYRPEYPYVALPAEDVVRGKALRDSVRGRLAAVNLGVGGNAQKRVEDPFEAELLSALIEAGYTLVLDRGAGEEELQRTAHLIGELRSQGKTVSDVTPTGGSVSSADVFVWEGSFSGFGGLVASADLYCGYDSAGGHLASAIGVPVIDIFTDGSSARLTERWTPWGEGPVRVIAARRPDPCKALKEFRAALREHAR